MFFAGRGLYGHAGRFRARSRICFRFTIVALQLSLRRLFGVAAFFEMNHRFIGSVALFEFLYLFCRKSFGIDQFCDFFHDVRFELIGLFLRNVTGL